jgi:hypothetical protein
MNEETGGMCTKWLVGNTEENHEKYHPGRHLTSSQSLNLAPPEY